MISVLIGSPVPTLRAGLSALLSGDAEVRVVAVISSLANLPAGLPDHGVMVLTVNAVPADQGIFEQLPDWAVLLVGEQSEPVHSLLGRRGWGWIASDASPEALQIAVRALNEGLVVASPGLIEQLLEEGTLAGRETDSLPQAAALNSSSAVEPPESLTDRELDVLRLAAQGLTNKQIAVKLSISEHTVKFHMSSIFGKLGVSNRAEAVRLGARWGWIPL